ncbi:MAG: ABC1 kinase family protein, partial [Armatimonadota bacterium]
EGVQVDSASVGLAPAIRIRMALEELGGTYVKLGQAISTRSDLVPPEVVAELRKLQDEVPPFEFRDARRVIQEEFGAEPDELFGHLEQEPAAAASLGQVHHGQLKTGEPVAVKVQRPGIAEAIDTDLQVLRWIAQLLEGRAQWAARGQLGQLVEEFGRGLREELAYTREGHNADRLRGNVGSQSDVYVPRVYWSLTTSRVLTLERVDGAKLADAEAVEAAGVERSAVAETIARTVLRQILLDGFFHGDPHGGNVLLLPDGRVAFVDFGAMGWLGRELRQRLIGLVDAMFDEDAGAVCDELIALGRVRPDTDLHALEREMDVLLGQIQQLEHEEMAIGRSIQVLMELIFQYGIRMPSEFARVMKTLILTEGVCRTVYPDFDFREVLAPLVRQAVGPRTVSQMVDDLIRVGKDLQRHARQVPRQLSQILTKIESDRLKLRVEYDDIQEPMGRLDIIANRISYSLVVSAILVASALMSQADPSEFFGLGGKLGLTGFLVAGIMGFWLLYCIFRSGRL